MQKSSLSIQDPDVDFSTASSKIVINENDSNLYPSAL